MFIANNNSKLATLCRYPETAGPDQQLGNEGATLEVDQLSCLEEESFSDFPSSEDGLLPKTATEIKSLRRRAIASASDAQRHPGPVGVARMRHWHAADPKDLRNHRLCPGIAGRENFASMPSVPWHRSAGFPRRHPPVAQ